MKVTLKNFVQIIACFLTVATFLTLHFGFEFLPETINVFAAAFDLTVNFPTWEMAEATMSQTQYNGHRAQMYLWLVIAPTFGVFVGFFLAALIAKATRATAILFYKNILLWMWDRSVTKAARRVIPTILRIAFNLAVIFGIIKLITLVVPTGVLVAIAITIAVIVTLVVVGSLAILSELKKAIIAFAKKAQETIHGFAKKAKERYEQTTPKQKNIFKILGISLLVGLILRKLFKNFRQQPVAENMFKIGLAGFVASLMNKKVRKIVKVILLILFFIIIHYIIFWFRNRNGKNQQMLLTEQKAITQA